MVVPPDALQPQPRPPEDRRWPVQRCLSGQCGAHIIWAKTPRGKNTPVDVEPNPAGTVVLVDKGDRVPVAVVVKADERDQHAGKLHTTHWATCKAAGSFRGPPGEETRTDG